MSEQPAADRRQPAFAEAAWRRRIRIAQGQEPADLVLRGGEVVDVFTGEIARGDVAISDGVIAGIGNYPAAREMLDVTGMTVAPSFIDAHMHTESTLVWLSELARAVVPHGTGAIVTDPHEMANVAGLPGIDAMRAAAAAVPFDVFFTVPSCVPASAHESPGAEFGTAELAAMLGWPEVVGVGELMSFPAVLAGDSAIAAKLALAAGRLIDGHAPGMRGAALQAYAGAGPGSDHESTALAEAWEKLRAGLFLIIRQGSSEHNLHELLPAVTDATYPRCAFGSDDRDCHALLTEGHVDAIVRQAIAAGLEPVRAIRLATFNPASHYRLPGLGAVAPGYQANLVVLRDLRRVDVAMTLYRGQIVAQDGMARWDAAPPVVPPALFDSVRLAPLGLSDLRLDPAVTRAVELIPGQIVTKAVPVVPRVVAGRAVAAPDDDLLKLVCVERHHATGRVGVGYVRGFGLKRGALASSIAHDAHNIIAVGCDDADILAAVVAVAEMHGGLAVVDGGRVAAELALPIAGLLSDRPLAEVAAGYAAVEAAAGALGSELASPFGILAFLALSVIPAARVTDRGFLRVGDE